MMSFFARPMFAVGFGAFLVCGDTCLHLEDWLAVPQHWTSLPFLLDDWPAGLFLLYGAVVSRRNWVSGRPYQAAAWGFNSHLLFASFLGNLEDWSSSHATEHAWISDRALVVIVGVMLALALGGLVSTLVSTNPPSDYSGAAKERLQ